MLDGWVCNIIAEIFWVVLALYFADALRSKLITFSNDQVLLFFIDVSFELTKAATGAMLVAVDTQVFAEDAYAFLAIKYATCTRCLLRIQPASHARFGEAKKPRSKITSLLYDFEF